MAIGEGGLVGRLRTNVELRVKSVETIPSDFKHGGLYQLGVGLAQRWAANNRQGLPILAGGR